MSIPKMQLKGGLGGYNIIKINVEMEMKFWTMKNGEKESLIKNCQNLMSLILQKWSQNV